jgi:LmbE family N-acetylglucosaminyl deacetylase
MSTLFDLAQRICRDDSPPPPVARLIGFTLTSIAPGQYRHHTTAQPRLYYKALLPAAMQALGLTLAGPEVQPTVLIDISAQKALKVRALRMYTTQADAQRLAGLVEQAPWAVEAFHQAYPPMSTGVLATGFWEDPTIFTLPSGGASCGE